jgi:endonuclease/exonuclease/phosphatase (EEP) superfamily protein YafD
MRKLYRLWEIVKWKRKSQPVITNISKQAREQERQQAEAYGVVAAHRARAITLAAREQKRRR